MISQLASPSVCVIDEDPKDYGPLLEALNELYVSAIHIKGDDSSLLPKKPFAGLRLVFLDLHLTAAGGKGATAHTANVFSKIVSPDTAPLVVVIWSKYATAPIGADGKPIKDGETEAEAFIRTLLEAEPEYNGRVIFVQMEKLKVVDRPPEWVEQLKGKIDEALKDQGAIDCLWKWDSLVKEACVSISGGLTDLAKVAAGQNHDAVKDALAEIMQRLAMAQAGGDFNPETAARHLAAVLTELLTDNLEHLELSKAFAPHGAWLGTAPQVSAVVNLPAYMNGLLLTSAVADDSAQFSPGTVYSVTSRDTFRIRMGKEVQALADLCTSAKVGSPKLLEWRTQVKPVVIEISPDCDVAQGYRTSALLVAGLIVPGSLSSIVKSAPSITSFPRFRLKHPLPGFEEQDVFLVVSHRFKATVPLPGCVGWLKRWFRLRELPAAALRNAHAGQASRVGFVEVK